MTITPETSNTVDDSSVSEDWTDRLEYVRNAAIVIGGAAALLLATWRGFAADRQSKATRQGLANDRYLQAGQLLGHKEMIVRINGIYVLRDLAENYSDFHYRDVIRVSCAYARNPPDIPDAPESGRDRLRDDVQQVVQIISQCRNTKWEAKEEARTRRKFSPALVNVDLSFGIFWEGDLGRTFMKDANFSGAKLNAIDFTGADLRGACFRNADLSGGSNDPIMLKAMKAKAETKPVVMAGADVKDADFRGANVSGVDFSGLRRRWLCRETRNPVHGLTQAQIDEACASENNPPRLDGVICAVTEVQLEWRGTTCEEGRMQGG